MRLTSTLVRHSPTVSIGSAASYNVPHPEARSPKGEASKDTPQHCILHPSNAETPATPGGREGASGAACRYRRMRRRWPAPSFEAPPGHLRMRPEGGPYDRANHARLHHPCRDDPAPGHRPRLAGKEPERLSPGIGIELQRLSQRQFEASLERFHRHVGFDAEDTRNARQVIGLKTPVAVQIGGDDPKHGVALPCR